MVVGVYGDRFHWSFCVSKFVIEVGVLYFRVVVFGISITIVREYLHYFFL